MQTKNGIKILFFVYLNLIFFCQKTYSVEWRGACEINFPPFNYIDKNGKKVGMDTEIIDLVMKKIGSPFSIQTVPWNEVFNLLQNEKVDFAWQFVGTPERKKLFHLVGPFRYGFDVFMVKKNSKILNWNALTDFNGKKAGVIKEYSYTHEFDQYKGFEKKGFNNIEDLAAGLVRGEVDFIIGDFYSLTYVSRKYHYGNNIRFLPSSIKKVPRYIAFSKRNKSKSIIFENALNEVMKTKDFQDIIAKYKDLKDD